MFAPIRVVMAAVMIASPSLTVTTAHAETESEPPSHTTYLVSIQNADLAGNPPALLSIKVGTSLEEQKIASTPTPVKSIVSAQIAPQSTKVTETYDESSIKQIAEQLCDETFGKGQFFALDRIVTIESGWNIRAEEPTSHAYGLGQALPASKMAPYGSDYLVNPVTQLKWLMDYIRGRYVNPESALAFHISHGWY